MQCQRGYRKSGKGKAKCWRNVTLIFQKFLYPRFCMRKFMNCSHRKNNSGIQLSKYQGVRKRDHFFVCYLSIASVLPFTFTTHTKACQRTKDARVQYHISFYHVVEFNIETVLMNLKLFRIRFIHWRVFIFKIIFSFWKLYIRGINFRFRKIYS